MVWHIGFSFYPQNPTVRQNIFHFEMAFQLFLWQIITNQINKTTMKKTIAILFALFTATTITHAQTLDEILNTMFETIGQDKLVEINSMQFKGKSAQMGMETPFNIIQQRPDKFRLEVEIQGAQMIQAYDGEKAWMTMPWTGSTEPQELSGIQLKSIEAQSDFDGILYHYADKGYTAKLIGTEEVEGTETFKIKLEKEDDITYYFIDAENFVIIKLTNLVKVNESVIESETYFSNYKEVNGIIMPFGMEQRSNGQSQSLVTIEEIEFDVEVDESIFGMPEKTIPAEEIKKL
jgi:outer membrane lipoprotein-sorting protein